MKKKASILTSWDVAEELTSTVQMLKDKTMNASEANALAKTLSQHINNVKGELLWLKLSGKKPRATDLSTYYFSAK